MPRTLTVARVTARDGAEAEYVRTVGALAQLSEARGRRLWLFRAAGRPGQFLECSESASAGTHRLQAALPEDERALEAQLHSLAVYDPDSPELWQEVRF
jgi:hypothetical protein